MTAGVGRFEKGFSLIVLLHHMSTFAKLAVNVSLELGIMTLKLGVVNCNTSDLNGTIVW